MSADENPKDGERSDSPAGPKRPRPRGTSPLDINVKPAEVGGAFPGFVAGASPAKFITVDKLKQINDELANMAIAHEIALDPEFSVEKLKERTTDGLTKKVTEIARRAFFDTIREKLNEQPPAYEAFFSLYAELKEMAMEVVTPNAKHHFDNVTVEEAQRQAALNCLDVHGLMLEFVNKLGQICAPVRDEQVESLRKTEDLVEMLKGTYDLLEKMKDDVVNFAIKQSRHQFLQHAAAYECEKFMKVLELYPNAADQTEEWLKEALDDFTAKHPEAEPPLSAHDLRLLLALAYARLLDGKRRDVRFPETLKYDMARVLALADERLRLSLTLAGVFVASNAAGKQICESTDFKRELKTRLLAILSDITLENYEKELESVYMECNRLLESALGAQWTAERAAALRPQIEGLKDENNSVRKIAARCLVGPDAMQAEGSRLPPGLPVIEGELVSLISRYLSVTIHNSQSFASFYLERVNRIFGQRRGAPGSSWLSS
ncbi:hypothetical protein M3Y99_00027200 [Aphelenchoides fujianensis]|nr:hypothetical protein M3Y99_00027200 [Aphelenchoides fujianensis]